MLAAAFDHGVNLRGLRGSDEVAERRRGDEHLVGGDATLARGGAQQLLGDDARQRAGEHGADARLLLGGEHVNDAVHGLRGAVGMEGAEDEHAHLGAGQRQRDGFRVAHFGDEDHVRVHAHGRAQRGGEIVRVQADLALRDEALLVLVDELDRLLDGEDVPAVMVVDVVDDARERGGFARAGRPGDEDQAEPELDELEHGVGQAELLEGHHLVRDHAHDAADAELLHQVIRAEARVPGNGVREVHVAIPDEILPLLGRAELREDFAEAFVGQDRLVRRVEVAGDAELRRGPGEEVQVGGAERAHLQEPFIGLGHSSPFQCGVRDRERALRSPFRTRAPQSVLRTVLLIVPPPPTRRLPDRAG